jgi:hypothetical protein
MKVVSTRLSIARNSGYDGENGAESYYRHTGGRLQNLECEGKTIHLST